ncbi:hypothetical protein EV182_004072, partial [Spiromyces aspiralis]
HATLNIASDIDDDFFVESDRESEFEDTSNSEKDEDSLQGMYLLRVSTIACADTSTPMIGDHSTEILNADAENNPSDSSDLELGTVEIDFGEDDECNDAGGVRYVPQFYICFSDGYDSTRKRKRHLAR